MRLLLALGVSFALLLSVDAAVRRSMKATTAPLQDEDFILALASAQSRLVMAQASRAFRGAIRTFIMTDNETMIPYLNKVYDKYREAYDFFPDEVPVKDNPDPSPDLTGNVTKMHGKNPGDFRAAMTPFAAHRHYSDTYKWLLYGDDDTVFYMPGLRRLLAQFDHRLPIAISDNLWHAGDHPRLEAYRCLPCGFNTSQISQAQKAVGYVPRAACPYCTRADACPPDNPTCDIIGAHGGAGMIFSVGLMRKLGYDDALSLMNSIYRCSGGDCLLSQSIWRAGFGFTDPGYSLRFDNPLDNTLFDNMSKRQLVKHPIEQLTLGPCDDECRSLLRHVVTFHVRGKSYASFLKAAGAVFGMVESHAAALDFLELQEDKASRAEPME